MKRLLATIGAVAFTGLLVTGCATTDDNTDIEFGTNTTSGTIGDVFPDFGSNTTSGSVGITPDDFGSDSTSGALGNWADMTVTLDTAPVEVPPSGDWVLPDGSSLTN